MDGTQTWSLCMSFTYWCLCTATCVLLLMWTCFKDLLASKFLQLHLCSHATTLLYFNRCCLCTASCLLLLVWSWFRVFPSKSISFTCICVGMRLHWCILIINSMRSATQVHVPLNWSSYATWWRKILWFGMLLLKWFTHAYEAVLDLLD